MCSFYSEFDSVQLHQCPVRPKWDTARSKPNLWTNIKEVILSVDDYDDKESWEDVGHLFLHCPPSSLEHIVDVASCRGQPVCSLLI